MGWLSKAVKSVTKAVSKVASAPFKLVRNASTSVMKRVVGALTPKMPSLEIPTSPAATTKVATPQMSIDPETAAARRAALSRRMRGGIGGLTVRRVASSTGLGIPT